MNFVISFLHQIVQLLTLQTSNKPKDVNDEAAIDAYKWLIEKLKDPKQKEVEIINDPYFQPGKIYVFKYLAKYGDQYEYWDKHPIVLALGKMPAANGGFINVGVNISWYPPKARKYIIEQIRKAYKPAYDAAILKKGKQAKDQKPIDLDLYAIKAALDQVGFSFAIRSYLPSQIKGERVCISYENWDKAIKLDQPRIFPELQGKTTLFQIYKDYELYVRYNRSNRVELKKKLEESRKLKAYKFIK